MDTFGDIANKIGKHPASTNLHDTDGKFDGEQLSVFALTDGLLIQLGDFGAIFVLRLLGCPIAWLNNKCVDILANHFNCRIAEQSLSSWINRFDDPGLVNRENAVSCRVDDSTVPFGAVTQRLLRPRPYESGRQHIG